MARILGVFSQRLPHRLEQTRVRDRVAAWLPADLESRQRLIEAYDKSGISSRASVVPLEEAFLDRSFTDRNAAYGRAVVEQGFGAVSGVLRAGGWSPGRFHSIVTVSCTGVMIPAPDVVLQSRLGLDPAIRRVPITELGCVAGAAGLARAADLVDGHPHSSLAHGRLGDADLAILLAAEFPSLHFQGRDLSPANVISTALFGDGVAAAVLGPDRPGTAAGPRIVATRGHVEPGTARHLGFDLDSSGFHIVLGREVPLLVRDLLRALVEELLSDVGWKLEEIRHWGIHPGGAKIIRSILEVFHLPEEKGDPAREVLRESGNTSSSAILLVLDRLLGMARPGDRGLLLAFGPGFSVELLALEW